MALLLAVIAVLGAAIGSFLNVVVHRVPAGESVVHPPSACPTCGMGIRWFDNIPLVSWLFLRARCRGCGSRISSRYPLVELGTLLAFVTVTLFFGPGVLATDTAPALIAALLVLIAHLYFAAISIALTLIDLDTHRLPNVIVLPSYPVAIILLGAAALLTADLESAVRAAAGAGILFAIYLVLALVSPRGMGMGDVKLAGVVGIYLGWAGWSALAVGAFAAFLLGGVLGLVLIMAKRVHRQSGIPFGPWMLVGAWLGLAWGEPIAAGYLAVFGLS